MLPWWEQEYNAYFVTDCARDNGMCLINIYFFISWAKSEAIVARHLAS